MKNSQPFVQHWVDVKSPSLKIVNNFGFGDFVNVRLQGLISQVNRS
jgi:hypothetical protein